MPTPLLGAGVLHRTVFEALRLQEAQQLPNIIESPACYYESRPDGPHLFGPPSRAVGSCNVGAILLALGPPSTHLCVVLEHRSRGQNICMRSFISRLCIVDCWRGEGGFLGDSFGTVKNWHLPNDRSQSLLAVRCREEETCVWAVHHTYISPPFPDDHVQEPARVLPEKPLWSQPTCQDRNLCESPVLADLPGDSSPREKGG